MLRGPGGQRPWEDEALAGAPRHVRVAPSRNLGAQRVSGGQPKQDQCFVLSTFLQVLVFQAGLCSLDTEEVGEKQC